MGGLDDLSAQAIAEAARRHGAARFCAGARQQHRDGGDRKSGGALKGHGNRVPHADRSIAAPRGAALTDPYPDTYMTGARHTAPNPGLSMIFMTKSKQRRSYIARRMAENLDRRPAPAGEESAAVAADSRPESVRRFAYELPAWIALACIVAIPVAILVFLLAR